MPYVNCFGRTVLNVHIDYCLYVNMYDVSPQVVDERMTHTCTLLSLLVCCGGRLCFSRFLFCCSIVATVLILINLYFYSCWVLCCFICCGCFNFN